MEDAWVGCELCGGMLDVESRHGILKHGKVNRRRHRATALSLVSSPGWKHAAWVVLLEQSHVGRRWSSELDAWLRSRADNSHGG